MVLSPEERRGVAVIVGLLLVGATYDLWRGRSPSPAPPASPVAAPAFHEPFAVPESTSRRGPASAGGLALPSPAEPVVDLNRADAATLERLPGVGPVLARRILEHRQALGAFERIEDLRAVRGIGPRLLERLRPCVRIGATPAPEPVPLRDGRPPTGPAPGH